MSRLLPRESLVLMYHRLGLPRAKCICRQQYTLPAVLRMQIATLLAHGFRLSTALDIATDETRVNGHCSLTFDDGFASVYRHGLPLFREFGVSVTIFVTVNGIGARNNWDIREGDCGEAMLDAAQIRELADAGCEIASHTLSHPHLTRLSDAELRMELVDARHALEDLLGRPVLGFAYPYGEYDARVREAVAAAGYRYATTCRQGVLVPTSDLLLLPRMNIRWNTLPYFLLRRIKGIYAKQENNPPERKGITR